MVGECGQSAEWFNHQADLYEVRLIYSGFKRRELASWRQFLLVASILWNANYKKKMKPNEIIDLGPLEEACKAEINIEKNTERERLKEEKRKETEARLMALAERQKKILFKEKSDQ